MPLTTTVNQTPPDVIVNVTGGGGTAKSRRLDVHVTWDERVLSFVKTGRKASFNHKKGSGTAHWHKVSVRGATKFKICLKRRPKKTATTYVVACAMDPATGEIGSDSKPFA